MRRGDDQRGPSPVSPPLSLPVLVMPHIASQNCAAAEQRACPPADSGQPLTLALTRRGGRSAAPPNVNVCRLSQAGESASAVLAPHNARRRTRRRAVTAPDAEVISLWSSKQLSSEPSVYPWSAIPLTAPPAACKTRGQPSPMPQWVARQVVEHHRKAYSYTIRALVTWGASYALLGAAQHA